MTFFNFTKHQSYFHRHFHYGSVGVNLSARVSMCGFESPAKASYIWHGLKRGDTEIMLWQYTLSGEGELIRGGRKYRIPPGRAMLVKIPDDHWYHVTPEADHWKFVFIIFRGTECLRLRDLILEDHSPVSEQFVVPSVMEVAENILTYPETESVTQLSELAYGFMMRLVDSCDALQINNISPSLLRVRKYIINNFDRSIPVDELAHMANMSYAYFCREFIRNFGISPGKYISNLKFEKAINLLQNSFMSIKEISEVCGFSSPAYFCRAFFTRFNHTPSHYREREKM